MSNQAYNANQEAADQAQDQMRESAEHLAATSNILLAYSTAIRKQAIPDFGKVKDRFAKDRKEYEESRSKQGDKLPPLQVYMTEARDRAQTFLDELRPDMWRVLTDISDYADTEGVFSPAINEAVSEWEAINRDIAQRRARGQDYSRQKIEAASKRAEVLELISVLKEEMQLKLTSTQAISVRLRDFRNGMIQDVENLNTTNTAIVAAIGGDEGALQAYQASIKAQEKAIANAGVGVGLSCAAMVGGGAVFVVGGLLSATGVGAVVGVPLMGLGFVAMGAGLGGTIASGIALDKAIKEKSRLIAESNRVEGDMKVLVNISSFLEQLGDQAEQALTYIQSLETSWGVMENYLDNLVASIEKVFTEAERIEAGDRMVRLKLFMRVSNAKWQTLHNHVTGLIKTYADLAPKEVETIDDMQHQAAA